MSALREVRERVKRHNLSVAAAGIAFFGFLAMIPAFIAVLSVYGLIADPADIETQIGDALDAAPAGVQELIIGQVQAVAAERAGGVGVALAISTLVALWGASGAMNHMIATLNVTYEVEETRSFAKVRGLALGFTFGAVVVMVGGGFVLTVLPAILADTGLGTVGRVLVSLGRFPLLGGLMTVGLGQLYRIGPNRPPPPFTLFGRGNLVAAVLFVLVSALFGFYTANFPNFSESYGPLTSIVAVLTWFWLSALAVLIGGEVNAMRDEHERVDELETRSTALQTEIARLEARRVDLATDLERLEEAASAESIGARVHGLWSTMRARLGNWSDTTTPSSDDTGHQPAGEHTMRSHDAGTKRPDDTA